MKPIIAAGIVGAMVAGAASSSYAQGTVNVLWYTGGVQDNVDFPTYTAAVQNLVTQEENPAFNTSGSVNTWNVTFWSGGAMPAGSYNVLINASPEGAWQANPSYGALTSAITGAGGASSFFGNRVMLTGQDADWHYQNHPGPTAFNGPAGFLIDSINWAGSGTGMGGVILDPNGSGLGGLFAGIGMNEGANDTVDIPPAFATDPVNLGLTSAGLSGWSTSAHETFNGSDPSLWTAINVDGAGNPITIVSAAEVSGGTGGGTVPDGSSTALLGAIAFSFVGACRRWMSRA